MAEWAQVLLKASIFRRKEDSHCESFRSCGFLGRDIAVSCNAILSRGFASDGNRMELLRREISSRKNCLVLSERCAASEFQAVSLCVVQKKSSEKETLV